MLKTHVHHLFIESDIYLIKVNQGVSSRPVYDQVLDLAVLAKLQLEHLLRHVRGHAVHPDTLGGHTHPKP